MNIKKLATKKSRLMSGHRTCAGCTLPQVVRTVLRSIDNPVVVSCATGCLEVTTTVYPYTSWQCPFIHSAFENAAATISGVDAALKFMKKTQQLTPLVFAGDGGTYDIGLQALSGALERGHNFLYICLDNQAYMNTGNQRSSATPLGATTTTSPSGQIQKGKLELRKPLTEIVAAHKIPYCAQAAVSHLEDLSEKVQKALSFKGPKFINVLAPCIAGWGFADDLSIEVARLAVKTRFWPLWEGVRGDPPASSREASRAGEKVEKRITVDVPKPKPVEEFLQTQKRFRHLFRPENKGIIRKIQEQVDREWEELCYKSLKR